MRHFSIAEGRVCAFRCHYSSTLLATADEVLEWVSDPSVGWRLQGDETIGRTRCPIAYSERIGGSFPSDEFLTFLREAGVRDV